MPRSIDIAGVGAIQFPDEMTDDEIVSTIENDIIPNHDNANPDPELVSARPDLFPDIDRGSFFGGLGSGVERLGRAPEAVGAAIGRSQEELDSLKSQMSEDEYNQRYRASLDDVTDQFGRGEYLQSAETLFTDVLPQTLGESIPDMGIIGSGAVAGALAAAPIPIPGARLAGAVVGGAVAGLPTFFGMNVERQIQENDITDPDEIESLKAASAAALQGSLEGLILPVLNLIPGAGRMASRQVSELVMGGVEKLTAKGMAGRVSKFAAVGGLTEAVTEVGQQMLERAQAGLDVTEPAAFKEYVEAAVLGGLLGVGFGGVGGGVSVLRTKKGLANTYDMIEQKNAEQAQRLAGQERDLAEYVGAIPARDAPLRIEARPELQLEPINGDTETSGTETVQRRANATEGEFNDRNEQRLIDEAMDPEQTGYNEAQRKTLNDVKIANDALQSQRYTPEDLTANSASISKQQGERVVQEVLGLGNQEKALDAEAARLGTEANEALDRGDKAEAQRLFDEQDAVKDKKKEITARIEGLIQEKVAAEKAAREAGEMVAPALAQALTDRQAGQGDVTTEQNSYTIEELEALAKQGEVTGQNPEIVAEELQKLRRSRRPTTELYNSITEQDVTALAEQKNIKTGTNSFNALVKYITGADTLAEASPFRLIRMRETLNAIPDGAFEGEPKDLINKREQSFTHGEFNEAVKRVLNNNKSSKGNIGEPRYTQALMKEVFPSKSSQEIEDVRDEMERIGLIRPNAKKKGSYLVDNRLMREEFIPANESVPDAKPIAAMDNKQDFTVEERTVAATDEEGNLRRDENGRPVREIGYHVIAKPKKPSALDTGAEEVISVHNNLAEAQENAKRYAKAPSKVTRRMRNPETGRDKNMSVPTTSADLRGMAADPAMYAAEVRERTKNGPVSSASVTRIREALEQVNERRGLQKLGIPINVVNSVRTALGAKSAAPEGTEGAYVNQMIYVGLDVAVDKVPQDTPAHLIDSVVLQNLLDVLSHEQIHALKGVGVLNDSDMSILTRMATSKTRPEGFRMFGEGQTKWTYFDDVKASQPNLSKIELEEEAVAELFRDWTKDPSIATGKPASLFRRIVKFFTTLGGFFKENGARNVSDIFGEIDAGTLQGDGVATEGLASDHVQYSVAEGQPKALTAPALTYRGKTIIGFPGQEHASLRNQALEDGKIPEDYEARYITEGFMLSKEWGGGFVDRKEASGIALEAGQIQPMFLKTYEQYIRSDPETELISSSVMYSVARAMSDTQLHDEVKKVEAAFNEEVSPEVQAYHDEVMQEDTDRHTQAAEQDVAPITLGGPDVAPPRIDQPYMRQYGVKVYRQIKGEFKKPLIRHFAAANDLDAQNLAQSSAAINKDAFRVDEPYIDDPNWDEEKQAPKFSVRRWGRVLDNYEYQLATQFAPAVSSRVDESLNEDTRGMAWLDSGEPLPVVLLQGVDQNGAGFGREHIVAKAARFGSVREMSIKLKGMLEKSYIKGSKDHRVRRYVAKDPAERSDLDYQMTWKDPSDGTVYVLGLEKYTKDRVKYAAIVTFYPMDRKDGKNAGDVASENDIQEYMRMQEARRSPPSTVPRFSIAPVQEIEKMSPQDKVKELKKLQIFNLFDGDGVNAQLRDAVNDKSRSTLVFMTPDEYRLMSLRNLRNPTQVKVYADNIDRGMLVNELPRLIMDGGRDGTLGQVNGHEGRHRVRALEMLGFDLIPVIMIHDTHRWGENPPSDLPSELKAQDQEDIIPMPQSVIFPDGEMTSRLDDVIAANKSEGQLRFFAGLAYDQLQMDASVVRLKEEISYLARQTFATSGGLRQKVIRELSQPMKEAAETHGARVTNSAAQGMYGDFQELSVSFDASFPGGEGMTGVNNAAAEVMLAAKRNKQTDAFAAVEVPLDYDGDNVRPGLTIYFYPKSMGGTTGRTLEEVQEFIDQLQTTNVQGYTAFQSNDATSDTEGYEGIRFIWVPEYTGLSEADVRQNKLDTLAELDVIVQRVNELNIGSARAAKYIAALGREGTYDETAEALTNPDTDSNTVGGVGERGPWKRSVRDSVAERSGRGTGTSGDGQSLVYDNTEGTKYSVAPGQQLLQADPASLGLSPAMAARVNPIYRPGAIPAARMKGGNQDAARWLETAFEGEAVTDMKAELSPERIEEVATLMAAEVQLGFAGSSNAFDWYSGALDRALDVVKVKYPMIADDAAAAEAGFGTAANARFVFTYIMAVTSQNLAVDANAIATDKAFGDMVKRVKAGKFHMLESYGTGDKQKAMAKNFKKFGVTLDRMPGETFPEKLAQLDMTFRRSMTVKDWVTEFRSLGIPYTTPGQTAMDAVVYGSSILGPKIGNGFWQNLNQNFNPLTIDLWMRRTWGRLTGKSIGNPSALPEQRDRFKRAIVRSRSRKQGVEDHVEAARSYVRLLEKELEQFKTIPVTEFATKKAFTEETKRLAAELVEAKEIAADLQGIKIPEVWKPEYNNNDKALLDYAKRALSVWTKEYHRLVSVSNSEEIPAELQPTWARAAKTIVTNLAKPLDQVANGTQRRQIEAAGARTLEILAERGVRMTMADMQAMLWYPEKELWGALRLKLDVNEAGVPVIPESSLNESYDTAFTRILGRQNNEVRGAARDRSGGTGAGAITGQDARSQRSESAIGVDPTSAEVDGRGQNETPLTKFSVAGPINTDNFRNWFKNPSKQALNEDGSGDPKVLYFGAREDFDVIAMKHKSEATFVSESPDFVEDFIGEYETSYEGELNSEGDFAPIQKRPRIFPVFMSPKKIFDFRDPEHIELGTQHIKTVAANPFSVLDGIGPRIEPYELNGMLKRLKQGAWDIIEPFYFTKMLRENGFDGFAVVERPSDPISNMNPINYGLFNRDDIKSVFNEEYDRSDPKFSVTNLNSFEQGVQDRLTEKDKTIWNKANKYRKRWLSPGGLLPEGVLDIKVMRDGMFRVGDDIVMRSLKSFETAVKKVYGKHYLFLTSQQKNNIDALLHGDESVNVDPAIRGAVFKMRQDIDAMSDSYVKILKTQIRELREQAQGSRALDEEYKAKGGDLAAARAEALEKTIVDNKGTYVSRSYKVFTDPNWFTKLPPEVTVAALNYLATQYDGDYNVAELKLNELVKGDKTAFMNMEGLIKESTLGAKDLTILMGRKNIAPEIRALLGENTDADVNYARTMLKMNRLIHNTHFLNVLKEKGDGNFLFEEGDPRRPPEATAKLAGNSSKVMEPLNGMFTTPEVKQALEDALGKSSLPQYLNNVIGINGAIKYGKVVLSPATQVRNFMSAPFFVMQSGTFDLRYMKLAMQTVTDQIRAREGGSVEYYRDLVKKGVLYDTPNAGLLQDLLDDSQQVFAAIDNATGYSAPAKIAKNTLKRWNDNIKKVYRASDDFWKIVAYEGTKAQLAQAKPNLSIQEIEAMAAKRTRDTVPTYSLTGKGMKALGRFPLVGSFVAFSSEIIRTSINNIKLIQSDLKDPDLRPLAYKRMVGMAVAHAWAGAAASMTAALYGVDDDEEEAMRKLGSPWAENSAIAYLGRDDDGRMRTIDLSFVDPYNIFHKPLVALMRNQPWGDSLAGAVNEVWKPFFGLDIAAGSIFELVSNSKIRSGAPIFNPDAPGLDQSADIAEHLITTLGPGVVSPIVRIYKAAFDKKTSQGRVYKLEDEIAATFGVRLSTFDPKFAMYYRVSNFKEQLSNANSYLYKAASDINPVDDDALASAFKSANDIRVRGYNDMMQIVNAARKSGLSNQQIRKILRVSNLSKKYSNALARGKEAPKWKLGNTFLKGATKRAKTLIDRETADEFRRRRRLVRQLSRTLQQ